MKIKKQKIPIYKGTLVLIQADDLRKVKGFWKIKDFDVIRYDAISYIVDSETGYRYFVMAFTDDRLKAVVHECFHCMNDIFNSCDIDYTYGNDEHAAYLLEWLFERCEAFLKK